MTQTIQLGVNPIGAGPIGVYLEGHNDSGDSITAGGYGQDVFSATDAARAHVEHSLWDFSFLADDYTVVRWPSTLETLITTKEGA